MADGQICCADRRAGCRVFRLNGDWLAGSFQFAGAVYWTCDFAGIQLRRARGADTAGKQPHYGDQGDGRNDSCRAAVAGAGLPTGTLCAGVGAGDSVYCDSWGESARDAVMVTLVLPVGRAAGRGVAMERAGTA